MSIQEIITELAPVVGIVLISYLVGMALKAWDAFDDRKIPVLMAVCGGILGVVAYFVENNLLGSGGILSAIFQGVASGMAATGINQIVKQAQKEEVE